VIAVPTHVDNDIDLGQLEAAAHSALADGKRLVAIIAHMGRPTPGARRSGGHRGAADRLVEQYQLDYRPHIHADAVISCWPGRCSATTISRRTRWASAAHGPGAGRGLPADLPAAPGRFDRPSISQDGALPVHLQPVFGRATVKTFSVWCAAGRRCLSVPDRGMPSRIYTWRRRAAPAASWRLGQPAAVRQDGHADPAGASREMAEVLREHLKATKFTTVLNDTISAP